MNHWLIEFLVSLPPFQGHSKVTTDNFGVCNPIATSIGSEELLQRSTSDQPISSSVKQFSRKDRIWRPFECISPAIIESELTILLHRYIISHFSA